MSTHRKNLQLTGGGEADRILATAPPAAPPLLSSWGGAAGMHRSCGSRPPGGTAAAEAPGGGLGQRGARRGPGRGLDAPALGFPFPPELRPALTCHTHSFTPFVGGPRRRRGGTAALDAPPGRCGAPPQRGGAEQAWRSTRHRV